MVAELDPLVVRQEDVQTIAGPETGSSCHPEEPEKVLDSQELFVVETVLQSQAIAVHG